MTATLTGPDYIRGESLEQHLQRHGCICSEAEWHAIVAHHEIADDRDPQYDAAAIADALDEALAAIDHLRKLIADVSPTDDLTIRGTAHAAFVAYGLHHDTTMDENALLLAAADTHKQLADLLQWSVDVIEHDDDGAPDDEAAA